MACARCKVRQRTRVPQVLVQKSGRNKYEVKPGWGTEELVGLREGKGKAEAVYFPVWEVVLYILRKRAPMYARPAVWQHPSSAGILALILANVM